MLLAGEEGFEGFSRSWWRFGGAPGRAEARCLGQPDRIYSILHWVCRWHRQCLAFPSLHISQWRWYVRVCVTAAPRICPKVYMENICFRCDRRIILSVSDHDKIEQVKRIKVKGSVI